MELIIIIISAVFVNNIVFSQFLGLCPFLGVSNRVNTAVGMSAAVMFVMILSTIVTYLVYMYILLPLEVEYLTTISFILIIAALVQMVEIIIKKVSYSLYESLGVFLPLITTNCTILGVAMLSLNLPAKYPFLEENSLLVSIVFAFANSLAFALAMVLFSGIREYLQQLSIPKRMQGMPIALLTAGLLALAFMGFSGLV